MYNGIHTMEYNGLIMIEALHYKNLNLSFLITSILIKMTTARTESKSYHRII